MIYFEAGFSYSYPENVYLLTLGMFYFFHYHILFTFSVVV